MTFRRPATAVTRLCLSGVMLAALFLEGCGTSTGQASPAPTSSPPSSGPANLVANFTTTLQNVFLLTEGRGVQVTDIKGGQTATVTSGGSATWNSNGGLVFNGGFRNRFEARGITSFLTVEVVFSPSLPGSQTYSMPVCYSGMASASGLQPCIELAGTWLGTPGQGATSTTPTYSAYHYCCTSGTPDVGSTAVINTGVHVMTLTLVPNGVGHLYVDGTEVSDYSAAPTLNQTGLSGGFLEFGGSPLGYIQCPASTCGFNGTVYGVATYSSTLSASDVQHNYQAWQSVLAGKGINPKQATYSNNNAGAQGSQGSAVQVVAYGESLTWGHGLASPETQNYASQAAASIDSGMPLDWAMGSMDRLRTSCPSPSRT